MSEFDPTELINNELDIPYFMDKGTTEHYGKLEATIKWSKYTRQYFSQDTIWDVIDLIIKNKKPIYLGVFGETGNGKTSGLINVMKYLYKKYSPNVIFTPETFHHFYWLGHSVTLDPAIVVQYFREELGIPEELDVFLCIEEAEGVIPSDRATSNQNKDARYALDTLRANKIHIIFVSPSMDELDSRIRNGKLVLRLEVWFNDVEHERIQYDALIWAKGKYMVKGVYTIHTDYKIFSEDDWMPWCDTSFHDVADKLKKNNIYGDSISTYISSNEAKKQKLEELRENAEDKIIDDIQNSFEEQYSNLNFDKKHKDESITIIINNLLIPIIKKYKETNLKITDTQLMAIASSVRGVPHTGIYWQKVIPKAKRLATSRKNDNVD